MKIDFYKVLGKNELISNFRDENNIVTKKKKKLCPFVLKLIFIWEKLMDVVGGQKSKNMDK